MKPWIASVIVGLVATASSVAAEARIHVDGKFDDWTDQPIVTEKSEDATPCDWRALYIAHDADNLYFRYRCDKPIDLERVAAYNMFVDSDADRASGFRGGSGDFPIGADHLVQGVILLTYKGDGSNWAWSAVATNQHAVAGQELEFAVPRARLGNPRSIHLFLYGDNEAPGVGGRVLDVCPDGALLPAREKISYRLEARE